MSRRLLRLLPLLAVLLLPAAAGAAPTAVYAFGDSLSDRKNLFLLTGNGGSGGIPQPPYADGRFSNGPLWVEQLADALGSGPLVASNQNGTDFAYGGAMTGTSQPIDLQGQIDIYAISGFFPPAPPGALFTLWAGSNDVLNALEAAPGTAPDVARQAAQNVVTAAETLVRQGGARNLLFLDLADLGDTPRYRGTAQEALATDASIAFNQALATALENSASLASVAVHVLDVFSLMQGVVADPVAHGFSNVTDACVTGGYQTPSAPCAPDLAGQNRYLFWDDLHPTTAAHAIIAEAALAAIPEPATPALFGLALLGLAALRLPPRVRVAPRAG